MYENVTYEVILNRILDRVSALMDKREGSVIYDTSAPASVELQNVYIALDTILNETFADTASLYYLKRRASERGIHQYPATNAILKGVFTPTTLEIPVGAVFNLEQVNYSVIEKITDGEYRMQCDTAGAIGNSQFGTLIPVDYIAGLETAELTELLIHGEDEEDVEALRKRYLKSMTSQAYGGNIADYKEKVNSLQDVGGVKVTPVWNGGGTVKLTIISSEFGVPHDDVVTYVKNEADPYPNEGKGYGFAPIGHVVTVEGVEGVKVNIVTDITYADSWNWEASSSIIKSAIDNYFMELSKEWENKDNLIVRISQLESRILDCEGVVDIANTTLNGSTSNLVLAENQIPVRGTVNGN